LFCVWLFLTDEQLPKDMLLALLPLVIAHVSSSNRVVNTYAACSYFLRLTRVFITLIEGCIDRVLALRVDKAPLLSEDDVAPFVESALGGIFQALAYAGNEENEYLMRG
jgi:hypothetical protein